MQQRRMIQDNALCILKPGHETDTSSRLIRPSGPPSQRSALVQGQVAEPVTDFLSPRAEIIIQGHLQEKPWN